MSDELDYTTAIQAPEHDKSRPTKRQAVLLVMTGPTTGQTVYLETKDRWSLGRSTECDVTFHDSSVSRNHCHVYFKAPNSWFVQDLNSSNGTWINGERITERELASEDKIQLGSTIVVKFVMQDELENAYQSQLYESATKDSLTGLFSKRYFIEQLDVEFNFHKRMKKPLSLVLGDIDHFKKINDTYGHPVGDFVLKEIGRLFINVLRKGDLVGRYGGEEIIFFLRETPLSGAKAFGEKIRRLVETYSFIHEGKKIPVTMSLGAASFTNDNFNNYQELIKAADDYLYKAKQSGRNKILCLLDG